ncbi:MAG: S24 family peptidase [Alistipes sp.]
MADFEVNNRLKKLIDEEYKISASAFSAKYNDNGGVKTSQVLRLRNGLSSKLLDKIIEAYPEINKTWLLTGEGEMLKGKDANIEALPAHTIRYWVDVEATAGGVQLFDDLVSNNHIDISIPEFRDCTDAVNLYGDSMLPLYKSGQIIILKEWRESFIDFGNVYLIITKEGNRMVKYLRKGADNDHWLCTSENEDFDPFEIEKSDILKLFLVKGSISKNVL